MTNLITASIAKMTLRLAIGFMACSVLSIFTDANAQNLWSDIQKPIATDSTTQNEFYVGGVGSALFGGGTIGSFDISSWQNTSGTRVQNNSNLEARLRSTPSKFNGTAVGAGIVLGYSIKLTDKLSVLAELPAAIGEGNYSAALYGGLLYEFYEQGNFKLSGVAKLGYGQQVMRHTKVVSIQDSIPVSADRTGSSSGMVYNDYGQTVFTRNGSFLEGDHLLLSFMGIQYQLGVVADYGFMNDRLSLKGQIAYQGAFVWLDKLVIDPNRNTRTDNYAHLPQNPFDIPTNSPALVKADLGNTPADPKLTTMLSGVFVSVGIGVKF